MRKRKRVVNSKVIRVDLETFEKLHKLKGKTSFPKLLNRLMAEMNQGENFYYAGGSLFKSLPDARGGAILYSVQHGKPVELPLIVKVIGKDDGQ